MSTNIEVLEVQGKEAFEAAFAKLVEYRAEALFVGVDPLFTANRNNLGGARGASQDSGGLPGP